MVKSSKYCKMRFSNITLCGLGNSLVTLMCHLFNVYGLIHHFQLDMVKLHRFLGKPHRRVS